MMFGPIAALVAAPLPAYAGILADGASSVMADATGVSLLGGAPSVTTSSTLGSASSVSSASSVLGSASSVSSATTAAAASQSSSLGSADSVAAAVTSTESTQSANLGSADQVSAAVQSVESAHSNLLGDADQVRDANLCVEQQQNPLLGIPAPTGNYGENCTVGSGTTTPSNTPPVITVNPVNVVIAMATGTYNTLTGVTAADVQDGNLTSSILADIGTINTAVVGTTTVTYTVKDSGNLTATATRTVVVKDMTNGGGTGTTPSLTAGPDITITKTVGTYTTINNITVNNAGTSTVSVACIPATIDMNVVGSTTVSCVGTYNGSSTTNTVTYKYTVNDTTGGGGTGPGTPSLTAGPDITITKTTGTYTTTGNITINNAGSSTVTVVCTPAAIDMNVVAVTSVSCAGTYGSSTTNTATYKYTVSNGGGSNGGTSNGGGSNGGSTVIGSYVNPGEVLGLSTDECSYLNEYLKIDRVNNPAEVLKLQAFLKVYEGADVSVSGVFDAKTDAAVRAFQVKYKDDVLTPWGLPGSTGYVYYTTKKKINEIRCEMEFALSAAQKSEMAGYKLALANFVNTNNHVAEVTGTNAPKADVSTSANDSLASNSLQVGADGSQGFWAKIKNGLFAALGVFSFGKDETKVENEDSDKKSEATSTKSVNGVVNVGASCAANGIEAKSFAQKMRHFISCPPIALDTMAALLAIAFGALAFAMAAYLYRRTRGGEEAIVSETVSV